MHYSEHGGDCCGRSHIIDFHCRAADTGTDRKKRLDQVIEDRQQELIQEWESRNYDDDTDESETWQGPFKHCYEVVLAEYQHGMWNQILLDRGFKEVVTFENDNSGNVCHVYMLVEGA